MAYRRAPEAAGEESRGDRDLLAISIIGWLVSAAVLVARLASGAPLGADATLALVALIALPIAWKRHIKKT